MWCGASVSQVTCCTELSRLVRTRGLTTSERIAWPLLGSGLFRYNMSVVCVTSYINMFNSLYNLSIISKFFATCFCIISVSHLWFICLCIHEWNIMINIVKHPSSLSLSPLNNRLNDTNSRHLFTGILGVYSQSSCNIRKCAQQRHLSDALWCLDTTGHYWGYSVCHRVTHRDLCRLPKVWIQKWSSKQRQMVW